MSQPIAPLTQQATAIAELAADWAAEQFGDHGKPWATMNPMEQANLIGAVATHLAILEGIAQFKKSLS